MLNKLGKFLLPWALPAGIALGQTPPEKAVGTLQVSDGLAATLFAGEPECVNPTTLDIDHLGRVWMCEAINYRQRLRNQPPLRKEGDRVVILQDKDGDGRAETASTFYQGPELMSPLGIAVAKSAKGPGWTVYLCQSPDILVLKDADGDGKADGPPEKLLSGFQGIDHDHGVHGIFIGPEGRLYFSVGDAGVRNLKSSDGKGKSFNSNGTDCRAGTIWRCDMDGRNLELLAHNFRNNYMPAMDSFGELFISDNDDDGNMQTRICLVLRGGNYGYHPRGPGQTHWHEEMPGIVPKILRTGFGSPTGMAVYEGNLLPEKFRGQLLHADAGPRHIRLYRLKPNGAGYEVDREDIIQSSDTWFRPSDVQVAPDGSVLVADWYDPGVGGHGMGDIKRGRTFRLAVPGSKYSAPAVDVSNGEGIQTALRSPAKSVRWMAIDALRQLQPEEAAKLLRPLADSVANPAWVAARARWLLADCQLRAPQSDIGLVASLNGLEDPRLASQAERIRHWLHDHGITLAPMSLGSSTQVKREELLNLTDRPASEFGDAFYAVARSARPDDLFLVKALAIAAEQAPMGKDKLLANFFQVFPEWNPRTEALALELRPQGLPDRLTKALANPDLNEDQRSRLAGVLASDPSLEAGKATLNLLVSNAPEALRKLALEKISARLRKADDPLRADSSLPATVDALAQSGRQAEALEVIAAARLQGRLNLARELAASGTQPVPVREAAIRALGRVGSPEAFDSLLQLAETDGVDLLAIRTLGEFLPGDTLPPLAKRALEALKGLVESQRADRQSTAAETLAGTLAGGRYLISQQKAGKLPGSVVPQVGRIIRNSSFADVRREGTALFPAPGKLDPKKLPASTELAKRKGSAGKGQRLWETSLKSDLQCARCHMVGAQGGRIGPDLSLIGLKASRENLYDSILAPSKAIADQYLTQVITTTKGQTISGLLAEETAEAVTLRDANGRDFRIPKGEIEERGKSLESIMPANLVAHLTEEELVDLVEYLTTLRTASLTPTRLKIIGPFDNGMGDAGFDRAYPPEKSRDFSATYPGKHGMVAWKNITPGQGGYIDLQAWYGEKGIESVSYLAARVNSPEDQPGTLVLGADDCSRVWVNGKQVHEDRGHNAASPGMFRPGIQLKKGPNEILVKINNGNHPHGLFLTVQAEKELREDSPLP
ncbi:MAG: HEAT repeat domain-containing protein [Gemmataceae bacterium]|nr:HEAT repeat domain-containing protein [Gemmataceae bacterium]